MLLDNHQIAIFVVVLISVTAGVFATDCVQCPAGTFADSTRALCSGCPAGSCLNETDACTLCPAGYCAPEPGSLNCTKCAAGRYNPGEYPNSSIDCLPCLAGYYCPSRGTVTPEPCPSRHKCPESTITPIACPALFTSGEMSDECYPTAALFVIIFVSLAIGGAASAAGMTVFCLCIERPRSGRSAGTSGSALGDDDDANGGGGILIQGRGNQFSGSDTNALFGASSEDEFRGLIPRSDGPVYGGL